MSFELAVSTSHKRCNNTCNIEIRVLTSVTYLFWGYGESNTWKRKNGLLDADSEYFSSIFSNLRRMKSKIPIVTK